MSQDQGGSSDSAFAAVTGRLSLAGELFVAIGAIGVLAVDLLGDLVTEEYFVSWVSWAAAAVIVAAIIANRWLGRSVVGDYPRFLLVAGFVLAAVAIREVIDDARYDNLDGGATTLFAVLYLASGIVALIGAWQLWEGSASDAS